MIKEQMNCGFEDWKHASTAQLKRHLVFVHFELMKFKIRKTSVKSTKVRTAREKKNFHHPQLAQTINRIARSRFHRK